MDEQFQKFPIWKIRKIVDWKNCQNLQFGKLEVCKFENSKNFQLGKLEKFEDRKIPKISNLRN